VAWTKHDDGTYSCSSCGDGPFAAGLSCSCSPHAGPSPEPLSAATAHDIAQQGAGPAALSYTACRTLMGETILEARDLRTAKRLLREYVGELRDALKHETEISEGAEALIRVRLECVRVELACANSETKDIDQAQKGIRAATAEAREAEKLAVKIAMVAESKAQREADQPGGMH
jgi:hypothetical protein